ncbi:unnamed protein product, partial [Brassica rapa subsp. narinosa]
IIYLSTPRFTDLISTPFEFDSEVSVSDFGLSNQKSIRTGVQKSNPFCVC